jgi:hypothetical protein
MASIGQTLKDTASGERTTIPEAAAGTRTVALVLGAATVAMGLWVGIEYAYASSVMPGLADSSDRAFVEVMQRRERESRLLRGCLRGSPANRRRGRDAVASGRRTDFSVGHSPRSSSTSFPSS